jgi:hypothetical protein
MSWYQSSSLLVQKNSFFIFNVIKKPHNMYIVDCGNEYVLCKFDVFLEFLCKPLEKALDRQLAGLANRASGPGLASVDCVDIWDAIGWLVGPLLGGRKKSYGTEVKKSELLEQKKKIENMLAEGGDDAEFMPRHLIKGYKDEVRG